MNRESVKAAQNVAAGIAHELRTPVFGIASAAQLIRYRIGDDPVMERNIGRILRETERLNTLIAALTEYGRPVPVQLESADPDEVWTSVIEDHRGALESKALLVRHTPATPRTVCRIDRQQFADACGNGLTNAIDAAAEGSDLSVTSSIGSDGTWQSRLTNSGSVVPGDTLARAFDPLVTTKPGHAGIGLATVHRIVAEHGGAVSLDSTSDGDGISSTILTFTLPPERQP
ncbi:MAG TPA: HAMP domain-containing sensor histidine kinase [Gemmatimonadaceae bacterium]|jgi:signal transduction histidine kinase